MKLGLFSAPKWFTLDYKFEKNKKKRTVQRKRKVPFVIYGRDKVIFLNKMKIGL